MNAELDVILPFHRNDKFLHASIRSVNESSDVKINLILVDDRDRDAQIHAPFKTEYKNICYIATPGQLGYGGALALGNKLTRSNFIALMNSDDLVHPLRFKTQIENLKFSDLSYCGMVRIDKNGNLRKFLLGEIDFQNHRNEWLLIGSYGANASWVASRKWWESNMIYDKDACLDWRIAMSAFPNSNVSFVPQKLYAYRTHASQVTKNHEYDILKIYESWERLSKKIFQTTFSKEVFCLIAMPYRSYELRNLEDFIDELQRFISIFRAAMPESMHKKIDEIFLRRMLALYKNKIFSLEILKRFVTVKDSIILQKIILENLYNYTNYFSKLSFEGNSF